MSYDPAGQLVLIMNRLCQSGLTTASGGNLSILEPNGDIWITPSGTDKGAMTRDDICRVRPDGVTDGPYKPSVELPLHQAVYRRRPDLCAVLHAHSPALSSFALAHALPDIRLVGGIWRVVKAVTAAPYAPPGSEALCGHITEAFQKSRAVILENHGAVVGAETIDEALRIFQALELSATIELLARRLGPCKPLRSLDAEPYEKKPWATAMVEATPPHVMAFAVTDAEFDPSVLYESGAALPGIQRIPYGAAFPVTIQSAVICENDRVVTVGATPQEARNRMEVMEAAAKAIISAKALMV